MLYGVNALFDQGADYVILGIDRADVINIFGGVSTNHFVHVDGINESTDDDSVGEVYRIKHFQIGGLEYLDVPVILKDIHNDDIDIILGNCIYPPDSFAGWDMEKSEEVIFIPEKYALVKKFWGVEEDGSRSIIERIRNSWAIPATDSL